MNTPNRALLLALAAAAALATLAAGSAQATLKAVEEAWELPLAAAVLPASEGAPLTARRCADCPLETLRTAGDTRYYVRPGTAAVTLAELRKAAAGLAGRPAALLYVYYDTRTRAVRRLVLDAGP